ncbi:MAG: helix-turn-helix domain-containing protein [Bifidobacterium crudilactis]|jgi:predicted DNA-binding transcriptional regulator AlpA
MEDPNEDLLKPVEVAAILRISDRTLAKWRHRNKGPVYIRLGYNRVVYRRSEIDRWIHGRDELS